MKFYNKKRTLYLETYTLGAGLGVGVLQVRDGLWFPSTKTPYNTALHSIAFASKSLTSTKTRYSNIKREALLIPHGLETFHHQCFSHEVSITDHKPLVAII